MPFAPLRGEPDKMPVGQPTVYQRQGPASSRSAASSRPGAATSWSWFLLPSPSSFRGMNGVRDPRNLDGGHLRGYSYPLAPMHKLLCITRDKVKGEHHQCTT